MQTQPQLSPDEQQEAMINPQEIIIVPLSPIYEESAIHYEVPQPSPSEVDQMEELKRKQREAAEEEKRRRESEKSHQSDV